MSQERVDNINSKILNRNIPFIHMDVLYPMIPHSTKFEKFPTAPKDIFVETPITNKANYMYSAGEHPGANRGPVQGFMQNVDFESGLRNQYFSLQKCDQSLYVPTSNSDLYKPTIVQEEMYSETHPLLFKTEHFKNTNKAKESKQIFNNGTRFQRNEK